MNIAALSSDILLCIFESGNAATLLNLQIVCRRFSQLIAFYETSISTNLSKHYSWAAEYGLGAPFPGTKTTKQLLWCAQLDILLELSARFQPGPAWRPCSHLFSLTSGTELTRRLERGLAIYQRCLDIAERIQPTKMHWRNPKRVFWLSTSPKWKTLCENGHKKYIQGLSRADVFNYELLYLVAGRHTKGPKGCCEECRTCVYKSNIEASPAAGKVKTASSSGSTLNGQQSINPAVSWAGKSSKSSKKRFASFWRENGIDADVRVIDDETPSVSWEVNQAIPLAVRIAALPTAPGDASKLPAVIHRYVEQLHPAETRKAYVIFHVAIEWTWYSPKEIHKSINRSLGHEDCERELISSLFC